MVLTCCAYGCKETFVKNSSISFHCFPKDADRRKLWAHELRRENFMPTDHSRICSKHFTEDCFDREKFGGRWLKPTAIPTVFDFPKRLPPKTTTRKLLRKRSPSPLHASPKKQQTEGFENQQVATSSDEVIVDEVPPKQKRLSYLGDFKPGVAYSPIMLQKRRDIALNVINTQKKKLARLQQNKRRLEKKVAYLSVMVRELKKKDLTSDNAKGTLEVHFEESQFENNRQDNKKKLKQDAVPTLFDVPNKPQLLTEKKQKGIGCPKPGSLAEKFQKEKIIARKVTSHWNNMEKHFRAEEFENSRADGILRLKPTAVPTIFSHPRTYAPNRVRKVLMQQASETTGDTLIPDLPQNYGSMFTINMSSDATEEAREDPNNPFSESTSDSDDECFRNSTVPSSSVQKRKRSLSGEMDEESTSAALRDYLKARTRAYRNKNKKAKDSISLFFDSIAETVKSFPLPLQITVKNVIHNYVSQQALKLHPECGQSPSQVTTEYILPLVSSENSKLTSSNSISRIPSVQNFVSYTQVPTFTVNVLPSTDSNTKASNNMSALIGNSPLTSSVVPEVEKLICPKIEVE